MAAASPLPDSNLIQKTLAPAPWYLFAGTDYLAAHGAPQTPADLQGHDSIFMVRNNATPSWRLRHASGAQNELVIPLAPRLQGDDMVSLQQGAIKGLGIVALPKYIARKAVTTGSQHRVLPDWVAGDATITILIPARKGLLPSVHAFLDYLAAEFPKIALP